MDGLARQVGGAVELLEEVGVPGLVEVDVGVGGVFGLWLGVSGGGGGEGRGRGEACHCGCCECGEGGIEMGFCVVSVHEVHLWCWDE